MRLFLADKSLVPTLFIKVQSNTGQCDKADNEALLVLLIPGQQDAEDGARF